MAFTLKCEDLGTTCPYIGHGDTEEELLADVGKHAKVVHNYTDEQLNSPEMVKKVKAAVKKE